MKKLLVVVDYQKDFVDGSLGFSGAELLDAPIAAKIAAYHAAGDDVVFTFDTHTPDYLSTQEGRKLPAVHCVRGSEGWELYGETAKAACENDLRFEKPTFPSLALGEWLKGQDYGQIELVGLVSNICVLSNAVLAKTALPEVPVIVDAGCTASNDPALHKAALDVMEGLQIQVTGRE